jgi:hypothetical protein
MSEQSDAGAERAPKSRSTSLEAGQFTRLVAIAALLLSLAAIVVASWLLFAVYSSIGYLKSDKQLPKFDSHFDAIAAAAAVGRLDVLSMVLGLFAVVAAVGVIYSYTMFRSAAVEAAIVETRVGLPTALKGHLQEHGEALVIAALRDVELLAYIQARFTEAGLGDTNEASEVDDDAGWKEGG